jgi:hypothetical protein
MKTKRHFGPAMEGLEDAMEMYLKLALSRFPYVNYLEIGVEHGRTLSAMVSILMESEQGWSAHGVDIPNGPTLIVQDIEQRIKELGTDMVVVANPTFRTEFFMQKIALYLKDSPTFLKENAVGPVHFCLIDGDHTKQGVMADFLGVEKLVPVGGIVAFHDFSQRSVGESQPLAIGGGIADIWGACGELGLLDILNPRPGWRYAAMMMGWKNEGRELGIFERI